ncbi:replication initiation factor domain-containing protein [Paenibacillus polysaccharolyticus]|uniref:hypothetical protein n=1 Tax=Paenibacillus polysaccharolyticus TaxID=582692 RepID=UPI003AEDC6DD
MIISTAWTRKVQNSKTLQQQYRHLFKMDTPYQTSVIDGLHLLSDNPLEPAFLSLMKSYGKHNYPTKSPYAKSYSLGCVTLLFGPRFPKVAPYKIKINPSEGGLSLQQVLDWATFASGNASNLHVRRVDFKVDLLNYDPVHCMNRIWASGFRTLDDRFKNETLYLGSKRGSKSIIIYDKATQQKIPKNIHFDWTRVEVREKYDKQNQLSLPVFLQDLRLISPFQNLVIVDADQTGLDALLVKYKKTVIADSVVKTFKTLNTYQRKALLKKLDDMGKLSYLTIEHDKQLRDWLIY